MSISGNKAASFGPAVGLLIQSHSSRRQVRQFLFRNAPLLQYPACLAHPIRRDEHAEMKPESRNVLVRFDVGREARATQQPKDGLSGHLVRIGRHADPGRIRHDCSRLTVRDWWPRLTDSIMDKR